jgi:SAM-dependent methyltransferase
MQYHQNQSTRGNGILEPYLARLRASKANELIPQHLRSGRILDIGCGSYPYFLSHTSFKEKFAIDQQTPTQQIGGIHWHQHELNSNPELPFEDSFFSVITMLALIEHLDPNKMVSLFSEAYRTLTKGGMLIMTTPSSWSDGILRWMAKINLVSKEEINEHQYAYTLPLIGWYFGKAGFELEKVKFGYFEMMLNMWAVSEK